MIRQKPFHFGRINILPAADDHVLGPAENPEAALVEFDDIFSGGPAVPVKYGGGQFLIPVIPGRCMGPPEIEDAGLPVRNRQFPVFLVGQPDLVAGQHAAHGSSPQIPGIFHPAP